MSNIPWYERDERDGLEALLENKSKKNLNLTRKAGSVKKPSVFLASFFADSLIATTLANVNKAKKPPKPKTVLDTAVELQEIDLHSRIEIHLYLGERMKKNQEKPWYRTKNDVANMTETQQKNYIRTGKKNG